MKQTILTALMALGYHSLNQLSESFGMFVLCCHTLRPAAASFSRTSRQSPSCLVLFEKTRWKTCPARSENTRAEVAPPAADGCGVGIAPLRPPRVALLLDGLLRL